MRRGHDLFVFIFVLGQCYEIKKIQLSFLRVAHNLFSLFAFD